MFTSLILALAFGQVHGLAPKVYERTPAASTPMFIKDSSGEFKYYANEWKPDPSLYDGLPMVEKAAEVDGKLLVYQDFNISALSAEHFKTHYMNTPDFHDKDGNFIPSHEEVKAYHTSLIAHEEDPGTAVALPNHLSKRVKQCSRDSSDRCKPDCIQYIYRGVRQSLNTNVYGAYHYESDSLCGSGSISKTVSVTHVSGLTLGGYYALPAFGGKWLGRVTKFLSGFGIFPSKGSDSVSTAVGYSGNCGPFNVCFLWERPHFSVDKGVIVTQWIDMDSKRSCRAPTVATYEAHLMHNPTDPGGAMSHGICYSRNSHGCGSRVDASRTLAPCPNNY